jgi:hypothetical protein
MQTIADNIVIQPKEYKVSAVVPFMPFGSFAKMGAAVTDSEHGIMSLFSEVLDESSQLLMAQRMEPLLEQTRTVRTALGDNFLARQESDTSLSDLISPERMINKNSLDAMFESGKLLAFKTWMGTECRYVVITEVSSEKRGLEDDVWRVNLSLSEMPVLSLTPVTGKISALADQGWTLAARRLIKKGEPVIPVDTKKKELIGNFKNNGAEYGKTKNPVKVLDHGFPIKELGKVSPYGHICNKYFVPVSVSSLTFLFSLCSAFLTLSSASLMYFVI